MRTRLWMLPLLAAALLAGDAATSRLAGQGWIEPWPGRGTGLVRLRTAVTARVTGRVARVEVEDWFENRGGALLEGDYYYPLPGEGAFADLSLWQGDRELKGETMDAARARSIYEEIVRRKRDPALVELVGHGLLRARVFPIAPGETRRITLRYTQLLSRAGDALVFRYAAGRPGVSVVQGPGMPWPRPLPEPRRQLPQPDRPGTQRGWGASLGQPIDFRLVVEDGTAFRDPFSPTHELRSERADGRLTVRPVGELSGDFAVFLPLRAAGRAAGVSVVAYRAGAEDGYALITLSPGEPGGDDVPRDITLVLDVSGSMSGEKLDQAKRALGSLLGSLGAADRFRLVAFSSDVDSYRAGWTSATAPEIAAARRWVDGLQAHGSTDIAGALTEAFRGNPAEASTARLPIVVFLTDGLPTVGEQDPERIAQRAEQGRGAARVFAFGVGYDVNTRLLDRLTAAARGTTAYVEPGEDLERPIAELGARIRHPVLTDLRLASAPVQLRDVYPAPLPDLFFGDDLVLLARYRGTGAGDVAFEGRRRGRVERIAASAAFPAEARTDDYIPRLWASRRIGVLTRELRLHGRNAEVEQEVRELGLRYGLLTEFTAYLVQEPGMVAAAPAAFDATGQTAVKSAEVARARREATSVAALSRADAAALAAAPAELRGQVMAGGRGAGETARIVGGRRFLLRGEVWSDGLRKQSMPTVAVEPFSPAYFALLRELPELASWWSVFERVEVTGARVALRADAGGLRELKPAEIARLVLEFRAS